MNDPATAVQLLDSINGLLLHLAAAPLGDRPIADDAGDVRVVLRLPGWADFVRAACDDVFAAATGSPMVLLRARTLLGGVAQAAPPDRRAPLEARRERIERELADRYPLFWREAAAEQSFERP